MFKPIKTSLTGIIIGAVILSALIVLGLTQEEHEELFLSSVKGHYSSLARHVSTSMQQLMETRPVNVAEMETTLSSLIAYDALEYASIYDVEYNQLVFFQGARYDSQKAVPKLDVAKPWELGSAQHNGHLVTFERIGPQNFPKGYVVLVSDVNQLVQRSKRSLLWQSLPLIIVVSLIILLVSFLFVNRLLKPLYALSRFTQEVSESKNYSLRYEDTHNNEFGQLGNNINSLMDTIEVELTINHEQNQTLMEQQQTMTRLANFDSLTGLPNRQFVMDNLRLELARAKRADDDLVLMFFDLDGFKGINDSLGHETGDLILIEVADRVTTMLREGDLVARLGGDEFIILPDRDTSDASVTNMANRVISAFSESFHLRGLSLTVGVSIGIARAKDANYELSQLMSNADLAMYRSKAKGRGTYTIFTIDMVDSHKRKLSIANSIDQAISENEFIVYYQPKVDKHGLIIAFEALIRWQHPEFGMIMPGEFIPIAERGGKITSITQWMIEQVAKEMPTIRAIMKRRFRVSVNLSGHDLRHSGLFDMIHDIFNRHMVNPEYIEFEVTESAYLENFALSNKFFRRVGNMGCAISLDDFGTGYSSLSYLTQISIDTLKIDRQFIRELETSERSRLVTGTIIDLAKRLSLTICAEGIENHNQWDYLIEHGCDHVQGFLFSEPVPLDNLPFLPPRFHRQSTKAV
ncbi:EAL domain-containing protein [Alteromonas ponticola]|uniref:EAL domain-containing protein n=1 Tax=Alteromonas aquimaris TaxID=2998417 RepID=A0ABT3P4Z8_9ALTE|nr:EAL domain-containing protein [Alteromonas aquimaris]MCW8107822.1 EAL domain-containing protein [Alteromonas aquimaris]